MTRPANKYPALTDEELYALEQKWARRAELATAATLTSDPGSPAFMFYHTIALRAAAHAAHYHDLQTVS